MPHKKHPVFYISLSWWRGIKPPTKAECNNEIELHSFFAPLRLGAKISSRQGAKE